MKIKKLTPYERGQADYAADQTLTVHNSPYLTPALHRAWAHGYSDARKAAKPAPTHAAPPAQVPSEVADPKRLVIDKSPCHFSNELGVAVGYCHSAYDAAFIVKCCNTAASLTAENKRLREALEGIRDTPFKDDISGRARHVVESWKEQARHALHPAK